MGLAQDFASLLESENYSDLTITTQTHSFKVHKAIICAQSKVFAAMSDAGFRETHTSTFALEDDDPATVERMITFLYTGDYDQGQPDSTDSRGNPYVDSILMANTLVYSIADKYDISPLKRSALERFQHVVSPRLFLVSENFQDIVATVFATTPDTDEGLRRIVTETAARQIGMHTILKSEAWKKVLESNGAIGRAMLKSVYHRLCEEVGNAWRVNADTERRLPGVMEKNERLEEKVEKISKGLQDIIVQWNSNADEKRVDDNTGVDYMFEGLMAELETFKRTLSDSNT